MVETMAYSDQVCAWAGTVAPRVKPHAAAMLSRARIMAGLRSRFMGTAYKLEAEDARKLPVRSAGKAVSGGTGVAFR